MSVRIERGVRDAESEAGCGVGHAGGVKAVMQALEEAVTTVCRLSRAAAVTPPCRSDSMRLRCDPAAQAIRLPPMPRAIAD